MRMPENPQQTFTRKWRKYYLADEVDLYCSRQADEEERALRRQDELTERMRNMEKENRALAEELAAARDANRQHKNTIEDQVLEIGSLGEQLNGLRAEGTDRSEQLAQQNIELARLQKKIEYLNNQVEHLESQNTDEIVQEAIHKAELIVNRANSESSRMLQQTSEQRAQLMAACRAAYYTALQFKQDLVEHFRGMEKELDASIDTLQLMDHTKLSLDRSGPSGEEKADGDPIVP